MGYIYIMRSPASSILRIGGSDEPMPQREAAPAGSDPRAAFDMIFQREVPDPQLLARRLEGMLAHSRTSATEPTYDCEPPLAIRAIDMACEELWPPVRHRCPDCQQYFMTPHKDRRRMYFACPHCQNVSLNPRWDSA